MRLTLLGTVLVISGDTMACEGLDRLAREADCLVQCCYLADAEIVTPAQTRASQHIIADPTRLGRLPRATG